MTPLINSKFEFVSAKTASWSCNNNTLANIAMPTYFYISACTPEATCEFILIQRVNGSVTLDRSSRAAYHMLAEGVCTTLYMNATSRSRAANHMLAKGVCIASYVKLNLAVRQPSLAQRSGNRRVCGDGFFCRTFAPCPCRLYCGSGLALPLASKACSRLALEYVIGRINEEKTQRRASLTKRRHKEERFRP